MQSKEPTQKPDSSKLLWLLNKVYSYVVIPVILLGSSLHLLDVDAGLWGMPYIAPISLEVYPQIPESMIWSIVWLTFSLMLFHAPAAGRIDYLQLGIAALLGGFAAFALWFDIDFGDRGCYYADCWPEALLSQIALSPYIAGVVTMAAMALLAQRLHLIYRALIPPTVFLALLGLLKLLWPAIIEHLLSLT